MDEGPLLLFDGVCNVCNAVVQFVVRHERAPVLRFASLQSEVGRRIVEERGLSVDLDTVVVVDGARTWVRSAAAVKVASMLGGPWRLVAAMWIVPRPIRDLGYDIFARFRYRLFGRRDECMVPTPELRARFVE